MFQSFTTEATLPVSDSESIDEPKPSRYSWKTLTKTGLVFVTTTGAFCALKATGSFSLISSWLRNRKADFDRQETKLAVHEGTRETEGIQVYSEYSNFKELPLAVVRDSPDRDAFMLQRATPMGIPTKLGLEFQVNTYTMGVQRYPSVAGLTDGRFMVTWESSGQDEDGYGIYGQIFDMDGIKCLSEFQVSTYTINDQWFPSIAGLSSSKFVAVWRSDGQNGDSYGIYGQMFNASGTKFLSEFQVNTYTAGVQGHPSVAGLSDGKFVVMWESTQDGDGTGIFGQMFNANGSKFLSEFQVNIYTVGMQANPSITELNDGKFVVTWHSADQDGNLYGVYSQIYNSNSTTFLSEFQVNTYTTSYQWCPSIAGLSSGKFVVIWRSDEQDGDSWGVYGQMFNTSGAKFLPEFRVNTYTGNPQLYPSIAGLSDGKFVVTWESFGQDGNGDGIYGQIFNVDGSKYSSEFQINTYTTSGQECPSIAGLNDSKFVVIWMSKDQDGDNYGIFGQMFVANETFASSYLSSSQQISESSSAVSSYDSPASSPGTSSSVIPTSSVKSSSHLSDQSVSSAKKSSLSLSDTKSESLSESFGSSSGVTSQSTSAVKTSSPTSTLGSSTQEESSDSFLITSDQSQKLSNSEAGGIISIGTIIGIIVGGASVVLCIVGGTVGYCLYRKNRKVELKEIDLEEENITIPREESKKERMSMLADDGSVKTSLIIPYKKLKLGQKIGGGGSGIVYKGRWQHTDVAIKQLHSIEFDPHAKIEFNREVTIMAALRHPNIVSLFGICFEPEFCIVMEYMEGGSLYSLLHSNEELTWKLRLGMAMDVTQGLAYLHEKDIVHRDIKSLNVLLDGNKRAKLTDFGLSKEKTGMAGTMTKGLIGTARWIAPELMDVEKYEREGYTKKADIYSYGMILYELSSRQVPFQEDENEMIVMKQVDKGLRPKIPEDCPKIYGILLGHCWRQRPEARPDINAAMEALETCCQESKGEEMAKSSTNVV